WWLAGPIVRCRVVSSTLAHIGQSLAGGQPQRGLTFGSCNRISTSDDSTRRTHRNDPSFPHQNGTGFQTSLGVRRPYRGGQGRTGRGGCGRWRGPEREVPCSGSVQSTIQDSGTPPHLRKGTHLRTILARQSGTSGSLTRADCVWYKRLSAPVWGSRSVTRIDRRSIR